MRSVGRSVRPLNISLRVQHLQLTGTLIQRVFCMNAVLPANQRFRRAIPKTADLVPSVVHVTKRYDADRMNLNGSLNNISVCPSVPPSIRPPVILLLDSEVWRNLCSQRRRNETTRTTTGSASAAFVDEVDGFQCRPSPRLNNYTCVRVRGECE